MTYEELQIISAIIEREKAHYAALCAQMDHSWTAVCHCHD